MVQQKISGKKKEENAMNLMKYSKTSRRRDRLMV
jgi:hypothetical protein